MAKRFSVCAILALAAAPILADDEKLDEIKVVSASGYEQNIADAPASIFVITKEQLERSSQQDLTDVLKNVPGISIEGGSAFKDVSIRGMSSSYTLYLIDGKPVSSNEAHSPNGMAGGVTTNALPPVSMIERIEVVRGPMSSLYGSEAMGGVINIITKKVPDKWSGSVGGEYTKSFNDISEDGYQSNVYLSGPIIKDILSLQTYGSLLGLDESFAKGGQKSSSSNPDFSRRQAGAKLIWALNNENSLYAAYDYSKQQRVTTPGKSIQITDTAADNLAKKDTYSLGHDAKYRDFVVNSYLQYAQTENNRQGSATGTNQRGIFYDVLTLNSQGTYFFETNSLSLGAQYRYEELEDRATNMLPSSNGRILPVTMDKWQFALFAEDEWRVIDDLAITAGARYNKDEKFGSHITPRIYAVYNISDDLVLKGGVSTGYKQPTLRQSADDFGATTGRGAGVQKGNPDLNPEKSLNYELGTTYSNSAFEVSGTAFYSEFKDKISEFRECQSATGSRGCSYAGSSYDFVSVYQNIDKAELYGLELSFRYAPSANLAFSASYTYQKSEQKSGDYKGMTLNDTPKNLASISAEYAPIEALSLWAQANYRGKSDHYQTLRSDNAATNKAYTLVDIGANYDLTKNVKLSAGIYNLFDKEIDVESFGKHIDGRRLTIGINSNF